MTTLAQLLPHINGAGHMDQFQLQARSRQEELQAARDEAAATATVAAEERFALRLEHLSAQQVEALEAARQRWSRDEAESMAAQLLTQVAEAERRIADAISIVLAPLVSRLLPQAALTELEESLLPALAADIGSRIVLHGPEDLVQQLSARLAARGATNIVNGTTALPELQADSNGLQAVTRLSAWSKALQGAGDG